MCVGVGVLVLVCWCAGVGGCVGVGVVVLVVVCWWCCWIV